MSHCVWRSSTRRKSVRTHTMTSTIHHLIPHIQSLNLSALKSHLKSQYFMSRIGDSSSGGAGMQDQTMPDCCSCTLIHCALEYFLGVEIGESTSRRCTGEYAIDDLLLCLKMLTQFGEHLKVDLWNGFESIKFFDPTQRDANGLNCLQLAAKYGFLDYVRYLVEECGFLTTVVSDFEEDNAQTLGEEALLIACLGELDAGYETPRPVQYTQELYRISNLQVVKYLVEEFNVSPQCTSVMNRSTPLMCAARNPLHLNIVRYLCEECNANVEAKNIRGETCFDVAQQCGNVDVVNYLSKSHFHLVRAKRVEELNQAVRHIERENSIMSRVLFGRAVGGTRRHKDVHYFTVSAAKQCLLFHQVLQTCPPLAEVVLHYNSDEDSVCTRRRTLAQSSCSTMRQWAAAGAQYFNEQGATEVRICESCHGMHMRELLLAMSYPYPEQLEHSTIEYAVQRAPQRQPSAKETVNALQFCEMVQRWELDERFHPTAWIHEIMRYVRACVALWRRRTIVLPQQISESVLLVSALPLWRELFPHNAQVHEFLAIHVCRCLDQDVPREHVEWLLEKLHDAEDSMHDEESSAASLLTKLQSALQCGEKHSPGEHQHQDST